PQTQVASVPPTIRFSPPACDYAVSFPARPEVGANADQSRYIAVATTGAASQRTVYYAECVGEAGVGADRAAELLASLARAEGLVEIEAFDIDTAVGRGYALTGRNTVASTAYRHRYIVVPGPMSAMVYGAASPASGYLSSDVEAHFASIEMQ
ncbi:MAG: hypothetical protein RLO50_10910, partial [Azospirillaceae bacterium]